MMVGSPVLLLLAAMAWIYWWVIRLLGPGRSEDEIQRMEMRADPDAHNARQLAGIETRATLFGFMGWIAVALYIGSVVLDLW
jgi:hypothetical protein